MGKVKSFFSLNQIVLLVVMAIVAVLFSNNMPAEWFDNFGLIVFSSLALLALWELKTRKETPDWVAYATFLIAVLGLIVDGIIVWRGIIN